MNDEIKEILDRIETASEIFDCLLKPKECTELLDYITNLQQDTEMYAQLKDEYEEEIKDLQQENERLKEANVYCNRTDCVGRIKDSRKYDSVYQEKEDYKSRVEKAVGLIHDKLDRFDCDGSMAVSMSISYFKEDLLNILQNGSDDNE